MPSPFSYVLGTSQGRIVPVNATATDGTSVFCLGIDQLPAPAFDFAVGDAATLTQSIDLTGINLLRATWRVRQPADVPRNIQLVGGTALGALRHGSIFGIASFHARLTVGVGASSVRYWAVATGTPVLPIRIAYVDEGAGVPDRPLGVATVPTGGNIDITVFPAKVAGAITSTAADVAAAINLDLAASVQITAVSGGVGVVIPAAFATMVMDAADEDGLDSVTTAVDFFTDAHVGRLLRTAGSVVGANNADRLIVGIVSPRIALLSDTVVTDTVLLSPGLSLLLVGARWAAELLVDGAVRASVIEAPGRDRVHRDLAAFVSKIAPGVHTVQFRFRLVEAA